MSAVREKRLSVPGALAELMDNKRAAILRQPAFQAGCREFEFRLPVLDMQEIRSKKERH